ncbi:MAG: hypothetical protein AVDCRST_MAG77-6011 [uncultured Chloroflexi bacterium]|uniref:RND efflux pump membrane fusion protein barrel-sandwich domain-containing protein n=1 Tax=uncultured Chloroflexota bacterium TaxID=166587 RepID=A0A6J4KJB2_9CHLR|nr:MAG: hypothetical protein AVDCRST_MAG77-6011 [uncultured Chloroflexota bacterium]
MGGRFVLPLFSAVRAGRSLHAGTSVLLAGTLVLAGTGCDPLGTSANPEATPAPRATPQPARATVQVRRATIVDAIKVLGRVVSSQEADLSFRNSGRIREVYVQPGDLVQAGQVLAELDQRDLPWSLAKARVEAERQEVRVAAAQAKEVVDDTRLDVLNVRAAEMAVDQALINVEKAQVGAQDADIKKAEADLAARRAELDRIRFDVEDRNALLAGKRVELELKQLPPEPLDIVSAQAAVETARIRLEQLKAGPRREDVRAAELALEMERTKLIKLKDQPRIRPEEIANAQLDVEKAQVALTRVLADIDAGQIRTEESRQAAVKAAQNQMLQANNTLDKVRASANESRVDEIRAQEQVIQLAEIALAKVRTVPTSDVAAAEAALASAQTRLEQVARVGRDEAELNALRAQVQSMELNVENARRSTGVAEANTAAASAKLDQLLRGPLDFDARDAQNKVGIARVAVDAARARLQLRRDTIAQTRAVAAFDVETLRRAVDAARLDVQNFESQMGDVKIVAPFAGRVTRVAARPGDNVNAFMPLFNVSSLQGLVVKADISEADVARIGVGMKADLTMDAFPNQVIVGTIAALPELTTGSVGQAPDRSTRIVVNWPGAGAEMGMLARVQVTLLVKPDVLMVPNGAVRTVGKRKFVEYMDGDIKRSRNVETGIQTDAETEITSGVQEGQVILAGQS